MNINIARSRGMAMSISLACMFRLLLAVLQRVWAFLPPTTHAADSPRANANAVTWANLSCQDAEYWLQRRLDPMPATPSSMARRLQHDAAHQWRRRHAPRASHHRGMVLLLLLLLLLLLPLLTGLAKADRALLLLLAHARLPSPTPTPPHQLHHHSHSHPRPQSPLPPCWPRCTTTNVFPVHPDLLHSSSRAADYSLGWLVDYAGTPAQHHLTALRTLDPARHFRLRFTFRDLQDTAASIHHHLRMYDERRVPLYDAAERIPTSFADSWWRRWFCHTTSAVDPLWTTGVVHVRDQLQFLMSSSTPRSLWLDCERQAQTQILQLHSQLSPEPDWPTDSFPSSGNIYPNATEHATLSRLRHARNRLSLCQDMRITIDHRLAAEEKTTFALDLVHDQRQAIVGVLQAMGTTLSSHTRRSNTTTLHHEALDQVKAYNGWLDMMDLNLFVVQQRLLATKYFASALHTYIAQRLHQWESRPPSSVEKAAFTSRLQAILAPEKGVLASFVSRAALYASKHWANHRTRHIDEAHCESCLDEAEHRVYGSWHRYALCILDDAADYRHHRRGIVLSALHRCRKSHRLEGDVEIWKAWSRDQSFVPSSSPSSLAFSSLHTWGKDRVFSSDSNTKLRSHPQPLKDHLPLNWRDFKRPINGERCLSGVDWMHFVADEQQVDRIKDEQQPTVIHLFHLEDAQALIAQAKAALEDSTGREIWCVTLPWERDSRPSDPYDDEQQDENGDIWSQTQKFRLPRSVQAGQDISSAHQSSTKHPDDNHQHHSSIHVSLTPREAFLLRWAVLHLDEFKSDWRQEYW